MKGASSVQQTGADGAEALRRGLRGGGKTDGGTERGREGGVRARRRGWSGREGVRERARREAGSERRVGGERPVSQARLSGGPASSEARRSRRGGSRADGACSPGCAPP